LRNPYILSTVGIEDVLLGRCRDCSGIDYVSVTYTSGGRGNSGDSSNVEQISICDTIIAADDDSVVGSVGCDDTDGTSIYNGRVESEEETSVIRYS